MIKIVDEVLAEIILLAMIGVMWVVIGLRLFLYLPFKRVAISLLAKQSQKRVT